MALDILTTATATSYFRNGVMTLYSTKGGVTVVNREYEKDISDTRITTVASGYSNKWDDVTYYTA